MLLKKQACWRLVKTNSVDHLAENIHSRRVISLTVQILRILKLYTGSLLTGQLCVTWKTMAGSVVW